MEAAALSAMLKIVGNKLAPLAIKEYSSILGVEKDLQKLKNLVEQVNDLLQPVGDRSTGDAQWLKNLKHVVYDADDVSNEFQLEAEKHDTYGDGGILVKYIYKKPKSVVFRWKAAKKIEEINKRFAAIVTQRTGISAIAKSLPGAPSVDHMNKKTVEMDLPIVVAASVFGRDQDKSKIITKLTEAKDQQEIEIVSVIGLGGSGKTTFARLVFNDGDIIEKHFKLRLWVHVSQDFDVDKLFKKLFEAITNEKSEHHTLKHMSDTISKELSEKVFLLVLDDVWIEDRQQWDQFREQFMAHLKSGPRTSKILLTTRSRRVAKVVDSTYLFDLPLLSTDDSWQLFARKFTAKRLEDFEKMWGATEFEEVGKEIVKGCGGVPLAIIALACVLHDKEQIGQWQAIRDSLACVLRDKEQIDGGNAQDDIFARLRLSYFHMRPHLKPCFTICSLFPKGYRIDKGQLIDQWIAHDMVAVEDGVGYLEYTADKYFDSLVQMSFLQDEEENYDGTTLCRMHDLVHDLARDILNNDETLLDGAKKEANFTKSYRYYSLIEGQRNVLPKNPFEKARAVYADVFDNSRFRNGKTWKNAKHLRSITVNIVDTQPVLTAILHTKNLRYLAVAQLKCEELPEAVSDIWSLQALHLTSSHLVKLPESIGKLQKLRTLNLFGCRMLEYLPDSIGDCHMLSSIDLRSCSELTALPYSIGRNEKLRVLRLRSSGIRQLPSSTTTLRNLECLDLRRCTELVELPEGIGNLEKLQVLNLKDCGLHGGMPVGIGQLSRLQKLDLFVVGEGENCARISELANLGRISDDLTIKGIAHVMEPDDAHRACLKQKTNLQRLNLWWSTGYHRGEVNTELVQAVLDGLEPPRGIKELGIHRYLGTQYARWMQNQVGSGVQGLVKFLFLRVMELQEFPNLKDLHGLVELPCLEKLVLRDMPSLASISGGPFPSLMSLYMDRLPSLGEVWVVAERIMPDGEEGGNCSHCIPHSGQVRVGSCLSDLNIRWCPKLKVKPFLPSSLQNLLMWGCSEQLLQSPGHLKRISPRGVAGQSLGCERGWELLEDMTALESLEIGYSDVLTELPEILRRFTSLRSLHVSWCPAIRMLPEWLGEFQSLQALVICDCDSLSSLPQSMGHLTSLRELRIGSCGALDQLPEWLGELRSLRELSIISLPGLTCLPRSMWRLPSLEELTIDECWGIESLPEAMKGLTSLRRLYIYSCPELERRCERGTGEDWHLISHISDVEIC